MVKTSASDGLENVARLLDLVPFLTSHQGISLEDLAKAFSVTTIQITKDLTTLWMCGLPGYTAYELIDLSFESGFVTISNAETLERPRSLTRDEILALLLGLETLHEEFKEIDGPIAARIESMIQRLSSLVDASMGLRVRAGYASNSSMLAKCEKAIRTRTGLLISYHSISRDEVSARRILPFEIFTEEHHSYLSAYCDLSKGVRTFRVDRILKATESEVNEIFVSAEARIRDNPRLSATVILESRFRDAVERLRPTSTDIWPGRTEIEIECFNQDWPAREIMSLGGQATVLEPAGLRNAIAQRAQRALLAYSKTSQ